MNGCSELEDEEIVLVRSSGNGTVQLRVEDVWTTDGFIGLPLGRENDSEGLVSTSGRGFQGWASSAPRETCELIELFPNGVRDRRSSGRRVGTPGWTLAQGIAIAVAAVVISVALFAGLGWLMVH